MPTWGLREVSVRRWGRGAGAVTWGPRAQAGCPALPEGDGPRQAAHPGTGDGQSSRPRRAGAGAQAALLRWEGLCPLSPAPFNPAVSLTPVGAVCPSI